MIEINIVGPSLDENLHSKEPDSELPYPDSIVVGRCGIFGVFFADSEKAVDVQSFRSFHPDATQNR